MNDETFNGVPVSRSSAKAPASDTGGRRHDHQRRLQAPELSQQQSEHQQDRHRQHYDERAKRFLLRFVLPADLRGVANWKALGGEHAPELGDNAAHVAPFQPAGDRHHLFEVFAIELRRAFGLLHFRRR
jgi:hypothetical protein